MTCDICQGSKRIRVPRRSEMSVIDYDYRNDSVNAVSDTGWKEFDCPQCVSMVPYRRVRAMKLVTTYGAEEFGRLQVPIERSLAARFGEFLLREGLVRFSQRSLTDLGDPTSKIEVTAHLGVVSREDVVKSGAVPEIAVSKAPALPKRLLDRNPNAKRWSPRVVPDWAPDEPVTDEFEEPKSALGARFSGLDIG